MTAVRHGAGLNVCCKIERVKKIQGGGVSRLGSALIASCNWLGWESEDPPTRAAADRPSLTENYNLGQGRITKSPSTLDAVPLEHRCS